MGGGWGRVEVRNCQCIKNQLRLTTINKLQQAQIRKNAKIRQLWDISKTYAGPFQEHLIIIVFNAVMIDLRTRLEESRKIF